MSALLPVQRASNPAWSLSRPRGALALSALITMLAWPAVGAAACPVGDPSVLYCEEFAGPTPLVTYTVLNPLGGNQRFEISVLNQALVYTNAYPGLAFASVLSNYTQDFRNTLFEADLRFDTPDAGLRSVMAIIWTNAAHDMRMQLAFQLDERRFNFFAQAGPRIAERKLNWPALQPNRTYRVGFKIDEVPGITPARPLVLAFKGYIDGTLVFSETEDTLGVDLSGLPLTLSPGFHGGSYSWSPVNQVFDNAIVRKQVRLSCTGFEPPLAGGPVTVSKNRALPFKMQLADAQGLPITALGNVPPVIQVMYTPLVGATVDVSDFAVPVGMGTAGNQFVFAEGKWQFNLQTKAYTAHGTYTVNVMPGDGYVIEPACTGAFVVK